MVDFTTFSERSGEEAAFTLMRSLSKLMDGAVRAEGGVVQALAATALWRFLARRSRSKTRPYERVARLCRFCNGLGLPDRTSKQSTVSDRI